MLMCSIFVLRKTQQFQTLSRKNRHIDHSARLALLLLLLFSHFGLIAQSLCNQPAGSVLGNFELEEFTFCTPKTVIVKDRSGGENIRYNFIYQGETAEQLNPNIPFQDRFRYTGFVNPTVFTIIQYGTKDGKPMYACKNHVVRQSNKANYSFTSCNRTSFSLVIPADSLLNDFDYYEISNDRFRTILETVRANDLPFDKVFNLPMPQRIYVRGVYNDNSKNCSGEVGSDFIANPEFTPSTGLNLPFHANIDALLPNEKGLELDIKGGLTSTFSLFRRDVTGAYSNEPVAKGLKPGRRTLTLNDPLKQSCFILRKEQTGCRIEESAEICSTPLTEIKQLQGRQRIFFDKYPLPYKGATENLLNNVIITEQRLAVIENQRLLPGGRNIPPRADSVDYEAFGCDREMCYYTSTFVQGNNNGINFRSEVRSNLKCYRPSEQEIEQNFSIIANVGLDNKAVINIDETKPSVYPISRYFLYQKQNNIFRVVDTLLAPISTFKSALDASESSYCFKIRAQNECGSSSELSDPFCTILLKFSDNKVLEWTKESPFAGNVDKYEVLTKGASGNLDLSFFELDGNVSSYEPNLNLFEDEVSFRIRATNSLGTSFSNIVVKALNPKIFLPSAFSPNSDGQNDKLSLIGNTERVKSVDFKILNRRGQVVFASADPKFSWEPKGSEAPMGSYYFDLKIILDNDETIIKNGSFSILK